MRGSDWFSLLQVYEVASLNQKAVLPSSPFGESVTEATPAASAQPAADNLADGQPMAARRGSLRPDVLDQNTPTGVIAKISREGKLEVPRLSLLTYTL